MALEDAQVEAEAARAELEELKEQEKDKSKKAKQKMALLEKQVSAIRSADKHTIKRIHSTYSEHTAARCRLRSIAAVLKHLRALCGSNRKSR